MLSFHSGSGSADSITTDSLEKSRSLARDETCSEKSSSKHDSKREDDVSDKNDMKQTASNTTYEKKSDDDLAKVCAKTNDKTENREDNNEHIMVLDPCPSRDKDVSIAAKRAFNAKTTSSKTSARTIRMSSKNIHKATADRSREIRQQSQGHIRKPRANNNEPFDYLFRRPTAAISTTAKAVSTWWLVNPIVVITL